MALVDMTGKKKILMVHHGAGIGGAPKSMSLLARRLVREGYDVNVLLLKDSTAKSLFEDNGHEITINKIPIYYFYHMSKWVKIWQLHKLILQLFSFVLHLTVVAPYYLIRFRPDVVYLNSSVLVDWGLASKALKLKTIQHVRETISYGHFGIRKKLIACYLNKIPDVVVNISEFNQNLMPIYTPNKFSIVYNYTEFQTPRIPDRPRENDFLYLGGGAKIKGAQLVKSLIGLPFKIQLTICGYINDQEFIDQASKDDRILFLGETRDVLSELNKSKFLLNLFTEPHFSRPVIEAFATGCIPVSTTYEGVEELISDGVDGFLIPPSCMTSPEGLSRFLIELSRMTDDSLKAMRENGYVKYKSKFSNKNEEKLISIIRGISNK